MFIPILAYHKIQSNFDFSITSINSIQFERQIKYLYDNGFNTISIADRIKQKSYDTQKIIITFDDGYASVFEHAFPILAKYNFTATIFVIAEYAGKWNTWDYSFSKYKSLHCNWTQIRELAAAGWEVGSHTNSHRNLINLSDDKLQSELLNSKDTIEEKIQSAVNIISYPFGKFDNRVLANVKNAGYFGGCTLGQNYPKNECFPFALFRRGVYLYEPFSLFKVKLQNNNLAHFDDIKQKVISFCSQGSILLQYIKSHQKLLD